MSTLTAFAILLALSPSASAPAQPTSPSRYELLIGEGLAGSGFIVRCQGQLWGVASIHQFDGATPSRFIQLEGEPSEILLQPEQVRRQRDVQAIRVQDQGAPLPFLRHEPEFTLESGARLVVLGPAGERVPGTLSAPGGYRSQQGARRLSLRTERPFLAGGGSGAPILLESTEAVVGVLIAADDAEAATRAEFETLTFCSLDLSTPSRKPAFADVAGRWTRDIDYAHQLWREEKGEARDGDEWQRERDDLRQMGPDEIRIDERSISFYKRDSKTAECPVVGWSTEGEVVWVRERHLFGVELRSGLVVRDDRLKVLYKDGTWKSGWAFRRAAPAPQRSDRSVSPLWNVIVGMVATAVLLVLPLGIVLLILRARMKARAPVPDPWHKPRESDRP